MLHVVSVLFWEVSEPTFKYSSFHLNYITPQTNVFIVADDEIVSATHLCEYGITLQTNTFNASDVIVSATHI